MALATTRESVGKRSLKALSEAMVVREVAPSLYAVTASSGREYRVDADLPACECDDWTYREPDGGCKHIRRVRFALGYDELPMPAQDPLFRHFVGDGGGGSV
jgi:hypothetical protein